MAEPRYGARGSIGKTSCTCNDMLSLRVLIIEDNDLYAGMLVSALQACGSYVVERAVTLAAAVEKLQQLTFDFILCDLGLPDSRGVQTVVEVKKHTKIPVIVLSGTDITSAVVASLSVVAEGFILKQDMTFNKFQAALQRIGKLNETVV
jgi:DNA-binding NarL/FixJ family response regulator